jgi:hypothetical protein
VNQSGDDDPGLIERQRITRAHGGKLGRGGHGVNQRVICAPALLRRKRRWVRSAFGGEFNAALVAPASSAE